MQYAEKIIEHLPPSIRTTTHPIKLDLILSGGAFNGGYMMGALYLLKEMEKCRYIEVKRISGCSIGALLGLFYWIDRLDILEKLYDTILTDIRKKSNLSIILSLKKLLGNYLPENICDIVNKKMYITYHMIHGYHFKKRVTSTYTTTDVLLDTIIRSCYLPFVIDYQPLYKNKYIDGLLPYFFRGSSTRKRLYINVLSYDKFIYFINITNEHSPMHRILTGLTDLHHFFCKGDNTHMCSYLEDKWTINKVEYYLYIWLEKLALCILYILCHLTKSIRQGRIEYLLTFFLKY